VLTAEVRAQITQIEKYNSAVNTFRSKFNAIPGDMNVATAQQFGFTVGANCTGLQGKRDGNALIEVGAPFVFDEAIGESGLFWEDLTSPVAGNLIDGSYPNSGAVISCLNTSAISSTAIGEYIPAAKIGHANWVYVYSNSGSNLNFS
jgi:hypothetical protein